MLEVAEIEDVLLLFGRLQREEIRPRQSRIAPHGFPASLRVFEDHVPCHDLVFRFRPLADAFFLQVAPDRFLYGIAPFFKGRADFGIVILEHFKLLRAGKRRKFDTSRFLRKRVPVDPPFTQSREVALEILENGEVFVCDFYVSAPCVLQSRFRVRGNDAGNCLPARAAVPDPLLDFVQNDRHRRR